jgi:molybdopterin synthase catalytic subunit
MIKIEVLFFSTFRDRVGTNRIEIEIDEGSTVADFKHILGARYPSLEESLEFILVAVNKNYVFDEEVIPDKAEVAVFPPVSGGSEFPTIFSITEDALDVNQILEQITLPTTGAACFFTGMVRAVTRRGEGRDTNHLEYEAYKPMAESKMQQVADEIREKWPTVEGVAIVQRIGKLMPGTPTVMIACTAGHRDTGVFEAARYGIDRLKQIVPIWKKEVGPDGEEWIEGEYIPKPDDR